MTLTVCVMTSTQVSMYESNYKESRSYVYISVTNTFIAGSISCLTFIVTLSSLPLTPRTILSNYTIDRAMLCYYVLCYRCMGGRQ